MWLARYGPNDSTVISNQFSVFTENWLLITEDFGNWEFLPLFRCALISDSGMTCPNPDTLLRTCRRPPVKKLRGSAGKVGIGLHAGKHAAFPAWGGKDKAKLRPHSLHIQSCAIGQPNQFATFQNFQLNVREITVSDFSNQLVEVFEVLERGRPAAILQALLVEKRNNDAFRFSFIFSETGSQACCDQYDHQRQSVHGQHSTTRTCAWVRWKDKACRFKLILAERRVFPG